VPTFRLPIRWLRVQHKPGKSADDVALAIAGKARMTLLSPMPPTSFGRNSAESGRSRTRQASLPRPRSETPSCDIRALNCVLRRYPFQRRAWPEKQLTSRDHDGKSKLAHSRRSSCAPASTPEIGSMLRRRLCLRLGPPPRVQRYHRFLALYAAQASAVSGWLQLRCVST
jgi:hypothetical protein